MDGSNFWILVSSVVIIIVCCKDGLKFNEFLGISYFTARDVFKKHVLLFVEDFWNITQC